MDLSQEETEIIENHRKRKKIENDKEKQRILDSRPASELSRDELLQRVRRLELEKFIDRANHRIIKHNNSGNWSWNEQDEPYIQQAYKELGLECPTSDW